MRVEKRKIFFVFLGLAVLVSLPSFLEHMSWFISGEVESVVVQGRWDLVLINSIVFLAFLVPLAFRRHVEWKSMGVYTAFVVSLFVEMYGIPLTIYLSSATVLSPMGTPPDQAALLSFEFLGQSLSMNIWKIVGASISIIGMVFVVAGWITLYRNMLGDDLVTSGVYSYSRHPQYVGIVMVVFGWFLHWPSILTLLMLPVLVYTYYKLSLKEEEEVMDSMDEPGRYEDYMEDTPRFI